MMTLILKALDSEGYTWEGTGGTKGGDKDYTITYLASITDKDGNTLGEFSTTQGSGWMYSVGGETYAGKGLSTYYLSNGDTLYLRFTLAYGKDIGGYSATAGSFGLLESYCGRWINGTYLDEHRWGEPQQTIAPDCTHPG